MNADTATETRTSRSHDPSPEPFGSPPSPSTPSSHGSCTVSAPPTISSPTAVMPFSGSTFASTLTDAPSTDRSLIKFSPLHLHAHLRRWIAAPAAPCMVAVPRMLDEPDSHVMASQPLPLRNVISTEAADSLTVRCAVERPLYFGHLPSRSPAPRFDEHRPSTLTAYFPSPVV